jgi:CRISPR-associated protein Cas1
LLARLHGSDSGLSALVSQVKSGDPQNVEARAARRYWPALFGDEFRRDRDGEPPNNMLNYGYAVLRAIVARAICASGLHPSIGLHHHNRYDAFVLADDIMEPLRPVVDRAVAEYVNQYGNDIQLDRQAKSALILPLLGRFRVEGESRTLFDIVSKTAISLVAVFTGERKNLYLPEI